MNKNAIWRWRGCGGLHFSEMHALPCHAINFSSEVSGVFLLRCVSRRKTLIWSPCFVSALLCVFWRACPHMMLLACRVYVWQQLRVWLRLECVCGLNSACVAGKLCASVCVSVFIRWNGMHVYRVAERGWVAACRDDGIGKRSLSLRPTAKPAGDAAAISSLALVSLFLSRPLTALFPAPFLFLSHFRVHPFHLFLPLSQSFSQLSPLLTQSLLMFSCHVFYLSCFLCIHISSCFFLLSCCQDGPPLVTPLTTAIPPFISDKVCVKVEQVGLMLK